MGRRWLRENESFTPLRPASEDPTYFEILTPGAADQVLPPAPPGGGSGYAFPRADGQWCGDPAQRNLDGRFEERPSRIHRDGGGGVILADGRLRTASLVYRVELAAQPLVWSRLNLLDNGQVAALDPNGITPKIAALAQEVAGEGTESEKLARIEAYLLGSFGYALDTSAPDGVDPIEYFLFDRRAGHCELFASAMVLMARSEGIPARFVAGFLGAEPNPLEDFHIVRQSNAHAWVEAFVNGSWQVRDPTPPAGRPAVSPQSLALLAQQLYDYVIFRWDRYVLTYGASDQRSLREAVGAWLGTLRDRWRALWAEEAEEIPPTKLPGNALEAPSAGEAVVQDRRWWLLSGALFAAALAAAFFLRRRRPLGAIDLFSRLRGDLEHQELGIAPSTPPLAVFGVLEELMPARRQELKELSRLYLAESFAALAADPGALKEPLAVLPRALRRVLAERRRARRKARRRKAA